MRRAARRWLPAVLVGALAISVLGGCDDVLDDDSADDDLEGLVIQDLGGFEVTSAGEQYLDLEVPDGAVSTMLIMEGGGNALMTHYTVFDPDGATIYSYDDEYATSVRCTVTDDVHTFLHATSPDEPLRSGTYQLEPFTDSDTPIQATLTAVHKLDVGSGVLDITFHFVGTPGLDAAGAPEHEGFQACLAELESILAGGGILLGDVGYEDVTSSVDELTIIESEDGPGSELSRLLALSGSGVERRLHLFMVQGINYGGLETLGQSGSNPGPGVIQGTSNSGIAVSTIDLDADPALTAQTAAHEIAHYLGLFHTTERDGSGWDPLGDTPICPPENDTNADGYLSASECAGLGDDNLMFWSPPPGSVSLSGDQEYVVTRSALPH